MHNFKDPKNKEYSINEYENTFNTMANSDIYELTEKNFSPDASEQNSQLKIEEIHYIMKRLK